MFVNNFIKSGPRVINTQSTKRHGVRNSSTSKESKLLIVPGANGVIAKKIIPTAIEKGFDVLGLSGNKEKASAIYGSHPKLKLLQLKHEEYNDSERIAHIIRSSREQKTYDLLGIGNTLGGTNSTLGKPDSKKTLEQLNIHTPGSFIAGALEAAKDFAGKKTVVNLSSIAATISNLERCTYAQVRLAGEKKISEISFDKGAHLVTNIRIGIVLNPFEKKVGSDVVVLDNGHNHSPENWKGKRLITVVGSGKQSQQPVTSDCVAEGVVNAAKRNYGPENWTVNGVSRDVISQQGVLTYFTQGKTIVCIHIPYEVGYAMTKLASTGRLQPYAVAILENLDKNTGTLMDPTDFEKLLERPAKRMDDLYQKAEIKEFEAKGIDLIPYIIQFLKSGILDTQGLKEFFKAVAFSKGWKISFIQPVNKNS